MEQVIALRRLVNDQVYLIRQQVSLFNQDQCRIPLNSYYYAIRVRTFAHIAGCMTLSAIRVTR